MVNVISLTKDKVWQTQYNGKIVYCKKTKINEVENLKKAKEFLENKEIVLNGKIKKITVPEIYKWDEESSCVFMQKCDGENLEIILRDIERRDEGVETLHQILKFILENKFYWSDFAPRNILIDDDTISMVDFERGLSIEEDIDIKNYFRENVYEEYVAFLLPTERPIAPEKIYRLHNEQDYVIKLKDVKSNRIKKIARRLNMGEEITFSKYLQIIEMLVKAEEPIEESKGNITFPIIYLEEMMSKYGYDKYIEEILKRNHIMEEERDV